LYYPEYNLAFMRLLPIILPILIAAYSINNNVINSEASRYKEADIPCQTIIDSLSKRTVYIQADKEPENEGGKAALIRRWSKISPGPIPEDYDTKFIVAFIVEVNGKITFGRIIKDKTGSVGQQMLDIIKSIKWKAGVCRGKKVAMLHKVELQVCLL